MRLKSVCLRRKGAVRWSFACFLSDLKSHSIYFHSQINYSKPLHLSNTLSTRTTHLHFCFPYISLSIPPFPFIPITPSLAESTLSHLAFNHSACLLNQTTKTQLTNSISTIFPHPHPSHPSPSSSSSYFFFLTKLLYIHK